jgi:hypothetical protein
MEFYRNFMVFIGILWFLSIFYTYFKNLLEKGKNILYFEKFETKVKKLFFMLKNSKTIF